MSGLTSQSQCSTIAVDALQYMATLTGQGLWSDVLMFIDQPWTFERKALAPLVFNF
jgi:hypothetical protein